MGKTKVTIEHDDAKIFVETDSDAKALEILSRFLKDDNKEVKESPKVIVIDKRKEKILEDEFFEDDSFPEETPQEKKEGRKIENMKWKDGRQESIIRKEDEQKRALMEMKKFLIENPNVSLRDTCKKFRVSSATVYRKMRGVMEQRSKIQKKAHWVKPKVEKEKVKPLVYEMTPKMIAKSMGIRQSDMKTLKTLRTEDEIKTIIMSEQVPEIFKLKDVIKVLLGTSKWDERTKSIYGDIRTAVNSLIRDGKVRLYGKEEYDVTKMGDDKKKFTAKHKRFVFQKTVPSTAMTLDVNGEDLSGSFRNTKYPKSVVIPAIKQAIFDGKMSYAKYGRLFGFDMRSMPDTRWLKLIEEIAHYVNENKMVKDVKIDFTELSLVFQKKKGD